MIFSRDALFRRLVDWRIAALVIGLVAITAWLGLMLGQGNPQWQTVPTLGVGLVIAALVVRQPHIGLALVLGSMPLSESLPDVPIASSLTALLGGLTLAGYIAQRVFGPRTERDVNWPGSSPVVVLAVVFLFWVGITDPDAAFANASRSWMFTLFQLLSLLWLAGQLLREPHQHNLVMWAFGLAAVVSAVVVLQQATTSEKALLDLRAGGLTGGANTVARYFVVALVFFSYLLGAYRRTAVRLVIAACMTLLAISTVYTVSRTGLVLLAVAGGLKLILGESGVQRIAKAVAIMLLAFTVIGVVDTNGELFRIIGDTPQAIGAGTGTVGLRYELWQAGLRMWIDYPIAGVGIGEFQTHLLDYTTGRFAWRGVAVGAHNSYIAVLAETGAVGLVLFLGMIASALWSLWRAARRKDDFSGLAATWLIVLVVMLVGGLSKHDQYEKLLWLAVGTSMCFSARRLPIVVIEQPTLEAIEQP